MSYSYRVIEEMPEFISTIYCIYCLNRSQIEHSRVVVVIGMKLREIQNNDASCVKVRNSINEARIFTAG